MNESHPLRDDPRLTAYALGELEGDERAEIEAAVCAHPALRAQVDQIRAWASELESALTAEPRVEARTERDALAELVDPAEPQPAFARESGRDEAELAAEAAAWPGRRITVEAAAAALEPGATKAQPGTPPAYRRAPVVRFPQFYYLVGGLAAACFALLVVTKRDELAARQHARAEALRVATQARAAAAEQASLRVAVAPVAGEAEEEVRVAEAEAALPAPETRRPGSFVPFDLALLEQVRVPAAAGAGPLVLGPMTRSVQSNAATLIVQRKKPDRQLALTGSGIPMAAKKPDEPEVPPLPKLEYVPSMTRVDAQYAVGGGTDLFPGPTRPAGPSVGSYSRTPAPGAEVVMLGAFKVSAHRDTSFGAMAAAARRAGEDDAEAQQRDFRPRAPAGARFGRNPGAEMRDNEFVRSTANPVSTFAAEVDSASYANVRRLIARGQLPPRDLVRIEELVNYFPYRYAGPGERRLTFLEKLGRADAKPPFAAALEIAEAPWAPGRRLVRVGLQGRELPAEERPRANLVFLVDVSSSMNEPNKLPLVKESLRLLLGKLRPDDRVAIVTYGGSGGVALGSTPVARDREIAAAIESLAAIGLADGATGIRQAYELAQASFAEDGINRVILCTDGDFALGTASEAELFRVVEARAAMGVYLTVLGFGMLDYRDAMLERLADHGNGHYGYIDSRREAQKILADEVSSTLVTIAKDVKIQVEFNPAKVASYRLIGYENRLLRREDFNTDDVDAGEIGAGHRVTALYEIVPAEGERDLRAGAQAGWRGGDALLTVRVRYKKPTDFFGRTGVFSAVDTGATFAQASADFRFAAAVAEFGMILRNSPYRGSASLGDVIAWAAAAAANPADDPGGYRGHFIDLARLAQELLRGE